MLDGGAPSADPLVRLAEHDELTYVHVERSAFSLGYEKGGAMQFAKGGYGILRCALCGELGFERRGACSSSWLAREMLSRRPSSRS